MFFVVNDGTCGDGPAIDDLQRQHAAFEREYQQVRREMLEALAELSEVQCEICKRKVIAIARADGDTLVTCRHLIDRIRQSIERGVQEVEQLTGRRVGKLGVELFDDGPMRW